MIWPEVFPNDEPMNSNVVTIRQDGKELGWAVANTFPVAAMESARVAYGGIAATVTQQHGVVEQWSMGMCSNEERWENHEIIQ